MMKVSVDDLNALRKSDPTLYAYVLPAARGVGDAIEIDTSQLREAHRKVLEAWARENDIEEPLSSSHGEYCSCDSCFQKRTREQIAQAEAEKPAKEMLRAGLARLQEYFKAGLVDSPENAALFDRTWREHPQLSKVTQSSPQIVDAVIALVRDKLAWRKAEPTPASVAPPQPVVTLSDGSPQKSLAETPASSWTIPQLQDYDRRKRLQAAGEPEALPPLEYVHKGRVVTEPRLPLGTKIGPQHSPEQIRDLNIRQANAHARATGSHGASWFSDSRGL
jgi:hypothetical protein